MSVRYPRFNIPQVPHHGNIVSLMRFRGSISRWDVIAVGGQRRIMLQYRGCHAFHP